MFQKKLQNNQPSKFFWTKETGHEPKTKPSRAEETVSKILDSTKYRHDHLYYY